MVTENGSSRYPPPLVESELRGRRRIAHPPRLDPLKIDPRAPRTTKSTPRSSPRSPNSAYRPRSRSPIPPPGAQHVPDDRPWLPMSLRAGSPQDYGEDWRAQRSVGHPPPISSPERYPLRYYPRDNEPDRPHHRKAPPARGGLRISMSTSRLHSRRPKTQESPDRRQGPTSHGLPLPRFPSNGPGDDNTLRTSFNSTMTSRSSIEQHSGTERSSVLTKSSSITDLSPDTPDAPHGLDGGMSVEDAISMYLDGFSDVTEEPTSPHSRSGSKAPSITPPPSRDTHLEGIPPPKPFVQDVPPIPALQPSSWPEPVYLEPTIQEPQPAMEPPISESAPSEPPSPPPALSPSPPAPSSSQHTSSIQSMHKREQSKIFIPGPVPPPHNAGSDTRDDYGFRKATQYITKDQYETWKGPYSNYTAHRRMKWHTMLQEHGLPTTNPSTFPAQTNKMKRFVRKGIPSEYRGAAWFWYAGGYELLNNNVGLYDELVAKVMVSPSNDDKEHIERDLHRTFPDNIHFKPDPVDPGNDNSQSSNVPTETQMIQSLRRVLYAYALHNPKVGYTQSLNFITGMLLLFLPEEKAFWMLHIVTSVYLPGTHEISLEGANIDLWILMVLLRDTMPPIYAKIASMGGNPTGRGKAPALNVNSRLPDITLGLTNWLMSVFIGTLPLETTLRVWDIFFYEGSKTFFRVSLAIFKACEKEILGVSDPMEVFQVVQTIPKKLLDANTLLDDCFLRKHRVGQGRIDELRAARRTAVRQEKMRRSVAFNKGELKAVTDDFPVRRRNPQPGLEHRVADSWRHLKHHAFR